jgi:hypothetical protein
MPIPIDATNVGLLQSTMHEPSCVVTWNVNRLLISWAPTMASRPSSVTRITPPSLVAWKRLPACSHIPDAKLHENVARFGARSNRRAEPFLHIRAQSADSYEPVRGVWTAGARSRYTVLAAGRCRAVPRMHTNILRDKRAVLFFVLGAFLLVNAVVAELIGVKLFQLEDVLGLPKADFRLFGTDNLSFVLSAGVLTWPLVFLATDLVNDYFGVRGVRFLTLVTAALIAGMFVVLWIAIDLPAERSWWLGNAAPSGVPDQQAAFVAIFGQGMNIIVGSLCAFLIAQMIDAVTFRWFKRRSGERRIWLRATGSTLLSQLVDSLTVTWVAFGWFKGMPMAQATALALTAYAYKFCVAVLATPVVYAGHAIIERWLGSELAGAMRRDALGPPASK